MYKCSVFDNVVSYIFVKNINFFMFLNGFNILILKKLKIKNNIILIYFKIKVI